MKILYIFIFLMIAACATPSPYENSGKKRRLTETNKDFVQIFNQWDKMKKEAGIKVEEDIVIGYLTMDDPSFEKFIALCHYYQDNTREIRVNQLKFSKLSIKYQKYIIFKQLAKCDANLPVSYKTDHYGRPISLRYYDYIDEDVLERSWSHYIRTIFWNI